jgi:hypothetical protein
MTPEEYLLLPEEVRLAIEIADHAAPADLESNCTGAELDGEEYYDLDSLDEDEKEELAGVIRYCELRGLLTRHAHHANLFQTLEP